MADFEIHSLSQRLGSCRPNLSVFIVPQIYYFVRVVIEAVVCPWSQLVLPAVLVPCVASTAFRHGEAELVVGYHVYPWGRRVLSILEAYHVFLVFLVEASVAVEIFKLVSSECGLLL